MSDARVKVTIDVSAEQSPTIFQVDDQVVVDAEHHKDHGRHGVVSSVDMAKDWPVGVVVGMGLGAVVHYFREDELVPQPQPDGGPCGGTFEVLT